MIASPLPATASTLIAQAASPEEQFSEATFLLQQGIQQIGSGEFQVALESFDQVIAVSRDSAVRETLPDDARQLEGIALVARGKALLELGDSAQATESIQQGMTIAQELNDPELEALAQQMLSEVDAP
jgi:tetratricopeptide (TPR) repeat protein